MGTVNRIIAQKFLQNITKAGEQIELYIATKTQDWDRPELGVQAAEEGFQKSVTEGNPLPAGTKKVVMRETEHPSKSESKDHYTAVCLDENGRYISTEHFDKK